MSNRENAVSAIMASVHNMVEDLEVDINFDEVNIDSFRYSAGNIHDITGDYTGGVDFRNASNDDFVIDATDLEEMLGQAFDAGVGDDTDEPALTDDQRHLVHRNIVALLESCIVITTIGGKLSITSAQSIADEVRNLLSQH